jgi:hypothetical protein
MARKLVPRVFRNASFLPSKQAHAKSFRGKFSTPLFYAFMGMV